MNIVEEYIQRKNLHHLDVVHHSNNVFSITKPAIITSNYSYLYIHIHWNNKSKGPGKYLIEFKSPIKLQKLSPAFLRHNDFISQGCLFNTISSNEVEYEDYENFIFGWANAIKKSNTKWIFPNNKDEARLMLWESFVFILDSYFADISYDAKNWLWESLNLENNTEKRMNNINLVMDYINNDSRLVCSIWIKDMLMNLRNYKKWIGDLFRDNISNQLLLRG